MGKLFEYMSDISLANKFYKRLAILSLCLTVLSSLFYVVYHTYTINKQGKTIYVVSQDGGILTAASQDLGNTRHMEAIDHAKQFVRYFFEVDKFTLDRNMVIAYDQGGSCIHALYEKLNKEAWFDKIKQYNVRQSVLIDGAECISTEEPYKVSISFRVQVTSEASPEPFFYELEMVFTMADILKGKGNRTENNIHALMIESIDVLTFHQLTTK
ncbi:hypothetical protein [Bacteroides acidifaciens]|uniref:hypothetical protein n=1 Tax=Bacteroides acidifaciens TaxID=85831 RepID=UPI002599235D|nr:hypothetical protein [Bacteroides acidifaciens]